MTLPNLSNSMYVAQLRHIQSIHESPERRNPDTLVRHFLPVLKRIRTAWIGQEQLSRLRADPFYYYLVARTKYYDEVVRAAVNDGVKHMIMVGCGSDTRAYRFKDLLCGNGVKVLECDQPESILIKQVMTRRWQILDYVTYLPIDLNDGAWPELESRLHQSGETKTLVLMEGVSPYVNSEPFGRFLRLLSTRLAPGSLLTYDFKLAGVKDDFGRKGRTDAPFRLPAAVDQVEAFHATYGLRLEYMEPGDEMCTRLLPGLDPLAQMFTEDGLVRLRIT